jgi:hypothetical protein
MCFFCFDKESISALRLSKLIEVNWRTAILILKKLRTAMVHRDSLYQLSGTIELDDALPALSIIDKTHNREARVTPSDFVDVWLL